MRAAESLVIVLVLAGLAGCFPRRDSAPVDDDRPSGRRVRVLDGTGEAVGALTLRGRSVVVSDARGIPMMRARSLPERIEVRDRTGELQLVLRPVEDSAEAAVALESPEGLSLGRLTLTADRLALYDAAEQQRGEVVRTDAPGSADELAVYGAPGTDLARLVRAEGTRRIELLDGQGSEVLRLEGASVPTWVAAVLALEPPAGIGEGTGDAVDATRARAAFQAGAVLFIRRAQLEGTGQATDAAE